VRAGRSPAIWWGLFFASVIAAWAMLLALQVEPGNLPRIEDPGFWRALCAPDAGYPALALMWGLMAVAMMAPSAIPFFGTYADLIEARAGSQAGLTLLVVGYLLAWLGFALGAAGAQRALALAGWLDPVGRTTLRGLDVALLAAAGLYQLSALKAACLSHCRAPLVWFIAGWRPGLAGALQMGVRHGLTCLGCCWALMLLAFVGGTMNLAWMGAAMVLMTVEKLPEVGRFVTLPLAIALLAGAVTRAAGFW
jgi:predicted metal-binding membrane protein